MAGRERRRAKKVIDFLTKEMGVTKIRFPETSAIGIKPVSREGTERLVRKAFQYAIDNDRKSVTLVHKGNIMKFTEGGFRDWGYALAAARVRRAAARRRPVDDVQEPEDRHATSWSRTSIADAFLQQILLRPAEYDVIATLNLNGDYISDALAAQVGGIGIAPGANLSDTVAMFEATHGTAPKYAGKDYVNPGSEILSAEMMLVHMGWKEAGEADRRLDGEGDRRQGRHLRLRAADDRREAGVVLGIRPGDDRADVTAPRDPADGPATVGWGRSARLPAAWPVTLIAVSAIRLTGLIAGVSDRRHPGDRTFAAATSPNAGRPVCLEPSSRGKRCTRERKPAMRAGFRPDRALRPGGTSSQAAWMLLACFPFGPWVTSKLTF